MENSKRRPSLSSVYSYPLSPASLNLDPTHSITNHPLMGCGPRRSGSKNGRKPSFGFVRGLVDPLVTLFGFPSQMHGNCSQWTSRALEMCGAVEREHLFPKATWVDMFEQVSVNSCVLPLPWAELIPTHDSQHDSMLCTARHSS